MRIGGKRSDECGGKRRHEDEVGRGRIRRDEDEGNRRDEDEGEEEG